MATSLVHQAVASTEQALLRRQNERMALLADAAAHLLSTDDPQAQVVGLFERVAEHLGADTFFNFMVNEAGDALHLDFCGGVPPEIVPGLKRLEFGQAICGTVAQQRESILACHIQTSNYEKADLVRGMGIRAYCCHPLMAGDRLLGTLSFASHIRDDFDPGEVELMRTICHYVAMAKERSRLLREAREELEARRKREREIERLNEQLQRAMQETHHRVRNNLQIVAAIVDMEAQSAQAPAPEPFRRISSHIRALATVHDILTAQAKRDAVANDMSARDLLENLVSQVQQMAGKRPITAHLDEARLTTHQGTSLAVVAHELLLNALKHGHGGVEIRFRAESGQARLEVADDGPGFPAGFDPATTSSTGLELVCQMARWDLQAGEICFGTDSGEGGLVTLTFPLRAAAS